jgi:hypothetical protein
VFGRFLIRPDGLVRSISRTIAEMVRERFQATRQRRLEVHPRVHRSWTFAGLRAFSNCLLRDLNTAVVSEEMMRGARSIYVDYVDYDEIATTQGRPDRVAGGARGLDQVWSTSGEGGERAPRTYHLVLLSDHGQSQGEPFAREYGIDLSDLCRSLTQSRRPASRAASRAGAGSTRCLEDLGGTARPACRRQPPSESTRVLKPEGSDARGTELIVLAGGNMAWSTSPAPNVSCSRRSRPGGPPDPGARRPPGVAFVSALSSTGPVAIGEHGRRDLSTAVVEGVDPCSRSGTTRPAMLATAHPDGPGSRALRQQLFRPRHDGRGGLRTPRGMPWWSRWWQDRGFVLAPSHLLAPSEPIMGGDELHQHLVGMLEALGHRTELQRSTP